VGRLTPWKGQHVLLEAMARAFPDGPEQAWLVGDAMFGETGYADRLRGLVTSLGLTGRVELRGFRQDVWPELAAVDVVVHASITPEPFGQVVIEGMAAGRPVVAANAGGPAEIVTDGVDGLLVPPDDVDALAAALRRLRDDGGLRDRLAAAGVATAARYTPAHTAERVLGVYRRLADTER